MPETTVEDPIETETPTETPAPTPEELQLELEKTRKALKAANLDAEKNRIKAKKLAEIEAAEEAKKTEKLGEDEKLRKRLAQLEAEARDAKVQQEVAAQELHRVKLGQAIESEARKQNFARPELVAKLVDRDMVEYDEEAKKFAGVVDAVKAVAKEYPELLGEGIRRGGGTPSGTGAPHPRQTGAGSNTDPIPALQQSLRESKQIRYDW
jgi:hypothetical protein